MHMIMSLNILAERKELHVLQMSMENGRLPKVVMLLIISVSPRGLAHKMHTILNADQKHTAHPSPVLTL